MKNKKGFIATSLIYSFFLIFITLFLSIIADYLQDKVLLNTLEKVSKNEINSKIGIKDIEVGEILSFKNSICSLNNWIVAGINGNKVILYSYDLAYTYTYPCTLLNVRNFRSDIEASYLNETYILNIIYSFDRTGDIIGYNLGENLYAYKYNKSYCNSAYKDFELKDSCIASYKMSNVTSKYRLRYEWTVNKNYNITDDAKIEN